jgi:hypothetical protein
MNLITQLFIQLSVQFFTNSMFLLNRQIHELLLPSYKHV